MGKATTDISKVIPLKMSFFKRSPVSVHAVELRSPDLKSSLFLRFPDEPASADWFHAVHDCIEVTNREAVLEANKILRSSSSSPPGDMVQIRHLGWLTEQV